jgi:DNA-binding transcriptional MerR regulator
VQIGQLSHKTGVSIRMLRYYEREGLLRPERTNAGYRRYNEEDVATIRRIILLNGAGLRLSTIRRLLPCDLPTNPDFEPCQELKASIWQTLIELDQQMAQLSESRKLLASLLHLA